MRMTGRNGTGRGDVIYLAELDWVKIGLFLAAYLMEVVEGVQKYFSAFQLSYENKTCSEC